MKQCLAQGRAQRGFSLVELMVASLIAMSIAAALIAAFVGNSRARSELDRSSRQIENGRFALELLAEELRLAGFYGNIPPAPIALTAPLPCVVEAAQMGWQVPPSPARVPAPLQSIPEGAAESDCLTGRARGSAAFVIRRVSTESLPPLAIRPSYEYVQVSNCNSDPQDAPVVLGSLASQFILRDLACSAPAPVRRVMQRTYYVGACSDCPGKSIPSLKRVELVDGVLQSHTLVEGIEGIGLDLGFDTNGDGAPDIWRLGLDGVESSPGNDWGNVMAVRIVLLSRTTEPTRGHIDLAVYDLGLSGMAGPFKDGFKRRTYSKVIRLDNPAGRREM